MKEKVMTKNYKKTFIILLIFGLLLGAVTGVAIPLSLRTQISEASVLREQARQQYEKDVKTYGAAAVGDWDEYEDNYDSQWHSQLTPLSAANYTVIGVLGFHVRRRSRHLLDNRGGVAVQKRGRERDEPLAVGDTGRVFQLPRCAGLPHRQGQPRPQDETADIKEN
jgi:hypothetical protein